ncbi:MAG: PilZ domain-containing protein [Polyangiales bacterium]
MQTYAAVERRQSARCPVDLWVDELHQGAVYSQRATDLTLGGAFLDNRAPHAPGARVSLTFRLLDGEGALRVEAEVVDHFSDRGTFVRFVDLTRPQRVRLANFLLATR